MTTQKHTRDTSLGATPTYQHDCDRCVFLGTVKPRGDDNPTDHIDTYWCANKEHPNLSSVIGRYGDDGCEYASSHPPECFAMKDDYLLIADRWYLYALLQATFLGLYVRKNEV